MSYTQKVEDFGAAFLDDVRRVLEIKTLWDGPQAAEVSTAFWYISVRHENDSKDATRRPTAKAATLQLDRIIKAAEALVATLGLSKFDFGLTKRQLPERLELILFEGLEDTVVQQDLSTDPADHYHPNDYVKAAYDGVMGALKPNDEIELNRAETSQKQALLVIDRILRSHIPFLDVRSFPLSLRRVWLAAKYAKGRVSDHYGKLLNPKHRAVARLAGLYHKLTGENAPMPGGRNAGNNFERLVHLFGEKANVEFLLSDIRRGIAMLKRNDPALSEISSALLAFWHRDS